ncbi:MAG: L-threonylcarbamoyladenylate synthase [Succinivibrio sp.]|nr:L-threonylcarbamoyladenylate synthase [Succinivibrio sp.]
MQAEYINIHPDNPQPRYVREVCEILRRGGVGVIPTDSAYALCCMLEQKSAMERIVRIREISKKHNFTLLTRDLSELSTYAHVDNSVFRLIKNNIPGPYTFIMAATKEVPRRLMNEKRRTIGMRVPDNAIVDAIIAALNEPLMSCTLILPGCEEPESDPVSINEKLGKLVDVIVDGGVVEPRPTTVIRFDEDDRPLVRRVGAGDPAPFES